MKLALVAAVHSFALLVVTASASSGVAPLRVTPMGAAALRDAGARSLVFDPAPQSCVSKKLTMQHVLEAQETSVEREGEPPSPMPLIRLKTVETVTCNDEYRATSNGAPDVLRRYYVGASFDVSIFPAGGSDTPVRELAATSPFRNLGVVFTRVPGEEYGRYFDGRESIEEALPKLGEDLDMRVLLPGREVKIGETWEIAPASLKTVLAAHGELPLALRKGADDPILRTTATGVGGNLAEVFGGDASGKVTARLASIETKDGAEIARIEVDVDLSTKRDQTALARRQRTRGEFLAGQNVASSEVIYKFRGRGTLTWNLKERRVDGFQLSGDEDVAREMKLTAGPEAKARRDYLRMTGRYDVTLEIGPPLPEVGGVERTEPAPAPDDGEGEGDADDARDDEDGR